MSNLITESRLPAKAASETFVLSKLQYLVDIGVWPSRDHLDYYGWLQNFRTEERPFALNMLNIFLYYNDSLVDALFRRAVNQLSASVTRTARSLDEATALWRDFLNTVGVTYVEGEDPNPTDSGLLFARKARQVLGIDEQQIGRPHEMLLKVFRGQVRTILLLDDFIGSGRQTVATWIREYSFGTSGSLSFALASANGAEIFYVPLLSTTYGLGAVANDCAGLVVHSAHVLNHQYSLTNPDSVLWPAEQKLDAVSVLYSASDRAGIVDALGAYWNGFHSLGLAVAFVHSIPDATLPLFFWDQNGWRPLIRRR